MADREAEVYDGYEQQVFGCVYGGKHYWLGLVPMGGHEEGLPRARHVVLSGAIAAFESLTVIGSGSEAGHSTKYVEVVNLKAGRTIYKVPTGTLTGAHKPHAVGVGMVTAIVVIRDGAVAWIVENFGETVETGAPYFEVHAVEKAGERVLAAGNGVAPASLALAGSTIYWTNEGRPESASLE
ncbi:MAG: hypothetical protein ACYCYN_05885 [Solirubrobacteraceae bacterium]